MEAPPNRWSNAMTTLGVLLLLIGAGLLGYYVVHLH